MSASRKIRMAPDMPAGEAPRISVVIPVYNEEQNVIELHRRLDETLTGTAEIIFVDDGSWDGTHARLREIAEADRRVRVIRFRRNYGQTAALSAGIDHARGEIIIPGMVSRMSGKLNELSGLKVTVGPRESSGLPKMMKSL